MKNYEEMAKSVLERRDSYLSHKRKIKTRIDQTGLLSVL